MNTHNMFLWTNTKNIDQGTTGLMSTYFFIYFFLFIYFLFFCFEKRALSSATKINEKQRF